MVLSGNYWRRCGLSLLTTIEAVPCVWYCCRSCVLCLVMVTSEEAVPCVLVSGLEVVPNV